MRIKKALSALLACTVVGTAAPVMSFNAPSALTAQALAEYTEGTYDVLTYYNYGDHIEITDCDDAATEVDIPAEIDGLPVTKIAWRAFSSSKLTNVNIPNSVTEIHTNAFWLCDGLTEINVHPDNLYYSSIDGVLFNKDQTSLIHYPYNKSGEYIIPDSVTEIGTYAFHSCIYLTDITISDSVTKINDYAFASCENLASIALPDNITEIGSYSFGACESLTSIIIPDSVNVISESAFQWCSSLTSVAILNPDCEIFDSGSTICQDYSNGSSKDGDPLFSGTIYGYEGSTAQAYAEKYERTFIPLINGDADLDGELGIADVVKIMTHTTTPGGTLNEIEMINADVYQRGDGISNMDALAVQKKIAQLISELPESEL